MSEPIYCFNGKECCYNIETKCQYYEGDPQAGRCTAPRGRTIPQQDTPVQQVQQPVVQTQVGGQRLISSLREGEKSSKDNPLSLKGVLVFDARTNERNTRNGPTTVTDILLKDDSGEVKISFWGSDGDDVKTFKKGDKLAFEGLFKVDEPYNGKPQMTGGKFYKVVKLN